MMTRTLALVAMAFLASCEPQPAPSQSTALRAETLNPETAERDARQAIEQGDRRLLAVAGFSLEVPGAGMTVSEAESQYGLREIEGTGDMLTYPGQATANSTARTYAERYNRVMLEAAASGGP